MHKLTNLSLAPGEDERQLRTLAAERLGVRAGDIEELVLTRRGLDARRRGAIRWVCSVRVRLRGEAPEPEERYEIPRPAAPGPRPVVAGFGPAGIFAALSPRPRRAAAHRPRTRPLHGGAPARRRRLPRRREL